MEMINGKQILTDEERIQNLKKQLAQCKYDKAVNAEKIEELQEANEYLIRKIDKFEGAIEFFDYGVEQQKFKEEVLKEKNEINEINEKKTENKTESKEDTEKSKKEELKQNKKLS